MEDFIKGLDMPQLKKISEEDIKMCHTIVPAKDTPILLIDLTTPMAFLSKKYPAKFTVNKKTFFCLKQYIVAEKAKLFNDQETYQDILSKTMTQELKNIKIKNYDPSVYNAQKFNIYLKANYYRLKDNRQHFEEFMKTGQKYLMVKKCWHKKMSPKDNILGKTLILLRYVTQRRIFKAVSQGLEKMTPETQVYNQEQQLQDSDLTIDEGEEGEIIHNQTSPEEIELLKQSLYDIRNNQ